MCLKRRLNEWRSNQIFYPYRVYRWNGTVAFKGKSSDVSLMEECALVSRYAKLASETFLTLRPSNHWPRRTQPIHRIYHSRFYHHIQGAWIIINRGV